jgi:hypothetical protein
MTRRAILILGFISAFSLATYLVVSHNFYRVGFPLDDAWIHQTYARNLALRAEWAFLPGVPSAGSTSPLWAGILAIGYLLKLGPFSWTFLLGWLSLWGITVLGTVIFSALAPKVADKSIWMGILLAFEWHLVWAAASGMETLIFSLLTLSVLGAFVRVEYHIKQVLDWFWLCIGILIGISVWLRPDGITLLGPALVGTVIFSDSALKRARIASILALGFTLIFVPYLFFNFYMAGSWWPNTFYAKQAEYAILQNLPFWKRLTQLGLLPLVGVGVTLLPGIALLMIKTIDKKKWSAVLGSIWFVGYVGLYAWRLPVTFQHGRYLIPMMPVFFVWGFAGLSEYLHAPSRNPLHRITKKSWILIIVFILLAFWVKGAGAYARDVAIIESEMVTVAHWVDQQLASDVLIAAHDIGALGYFSERPLLDLAGLISSEVIPFIRDEAALKEYLDTHGADYLITFPNWYPILREFATPLFQTKDNFGSQIGGENMVVYQWNLP